MLPQGGKALSVPSPLDLLRSLIHSALVQNERRRPACCVHFKGDLGVYNLQEILAIAFRVDFKLRLGGCLREKVIAFARDRDDEGWRELVVPNIAVEKLGIDVNLFVFLRWRQSAFYTLGRQIFTVLV